MLKQLLPVMLAAPLLFACGGNEPKKDAPKTETATSEDPAEETVQDPEAPEITSFTHKALYKSNDVESQAFYKLPVVDDNFPKLQAALTDHQLLGESIREVMTNYKTTGTGTTSADFKVTYSAPEVVSLIFTTEYMGAYPSGYDAYKTLDTQTGKPYSLSREINAAGIRWMLENYKKVVGTRLAANEKSAGEDEQGGFQEIRENLEGLSADDLEGHFVFTGKGIRVTSDDVMPHAALALEPDRVVDFSYEALKKYAAPTSVILKKQ